MSKVAIIGPSSRADADVDYTIGQVGITVPKVEYRTMCGNISSGVGPFAIQQGLVKAVEPVTTVKIYSTNTKNILVASVPVKDGEVVEEGDYAIDGVPGTGAQIALDFKEAAGSMTGKLLPTGNKIEKVNVEGVGELFISIVDFSNLVAFVHAKDIELKGTEAPADVDGNKAVVDKLEAIRGVAAEMTGMAKRREDARKESPIIPFVVFVSPATDYKDYMTGDKISQDHIDLVSRSMHRKDDLIMHETYPITITVCTGVAAMIPGTVVYEVSTEACKQTGTVRIGHPSGVVTTAVKVRKEGDGFIIVKAAAGRTSRRIMDGIAYVK
jgi:2-methylaconitate cis-trans-isomerase PrpF